MIFFKKKARIKYDWPDKALSPNGNKGSWRAKARATKSARQIACITTHEAFGAYKGFVPKLLVVEFYPPDNRRRDVMNTIASCKAMIDGIADAFGIDDSEFAIEWPPRYAEQRPGGQVIVEVRA